MQVVKLQKDRYQEWDDFVDNSPQGSIYAKTIYLDIIKKNKFIVFAVIQDNNIGQNNIVGGIVLFRNFLGIYSNPLLVKHLGIMYSDFSSLNYYKQIKMKNDIDNILISNVLIRLNSFIFAFHPTYKNWLTFYWNNYNQTIKYTYQINFSKQMQKYDEKVRAPMRKAMKSGLIIKEVDVNSFLNMIELTFAVRNTRMPFSKIKLRCIIEEAESKGLLYKKAIQDSDGNIHAVAAVVYDKNSANLILNGSDPKYRKFGGNSLLIDHMIHFAKDNCRVFDFEGSMHKRIESFYRGFGGELVPYSIISKNNFLTNSYTFLINIIKKFYK